jgi:hypothetical protein
MNRNQFSRWRSYQKTLMAVYWLSEDDGMRCYATWRELAAETGLYVDTVKFYVRQLESNGIISIPTIRDRRPRRTVVLLDHPDAATYIHRLRSQRHTTTIRA